MVTLFLQKQAYTIKIKYTFQHEKKIVKFGIKTFVVVCNNYTQMCLVLGFGPNL